MRLLDRYFAASEERHARLDEGYKNCGAFHLGAFEPPGDRPFTDIGAFIAAAQRAMADAEEFYSLGSGGDDFCLDDDGARLTFTSAVYDGTLNDSVPVRIVKGRRPTAKAVIFLPHWNAVTEDYLPLANALSRFGFDGFILTLPHHGARAPSSPGGVANAFLNADLGSAIRSVRQSVLDVKRLIGWLKRTGYDEIHLVGASLGSSVASLTTAFDSRIKRCALLLTAGDFADTVWTGRATAHIRRAIENHIGPEQFRKAWAIISPVHFVDKFVSNESRLLMVSGRRDQVVRFGLATDYVNALNHAGVNLKWRVLPCGHYTLSMFPFSIMMVAEVLRFLRR